MSYLLPAKTQFAQLGFEFTGVTGANAVAGVYGTVQLWNPAASGKIVTLNAVIPYIATAPASEFYVELVKNTVELSGTVISGLNNLVGGASSSSQLVTSTIASVPPPPLYGFAFNGTNNAFDPVNLVADGAPIVIPPGNGVSVVISLVNTFIGAIYQWSEQ